jgi:hypothetical protein
MMAAGKAFLSKRWSAVVTNLPASLRGLMIATRTSHLVVPSPNRARHGRRIHSAYGWIGHFRGQPQGTTLRI